LLLHRQWFEERALQLETLDNQLKKLHASIETLVLHRRGLCLRLSVYVCVCLCLCVSAYVCVSVCPVINTVCSNPQMFSRRFVGDLGFGQCNVCMCECVFCVISSNKLSITKSTSSVASSPIRSHHTDGPSRPCYIHYCRLLLNRPVFWVWVKN